MGKWCRHAILFIFDRIIIKIAGNQDRHKSSVKFDFGPNQTTHFRVTCPWVTKISHFRTWISLKPVGQSWSNFMCSLIMVGEKLHKVLGQIDLAHWTQVSDRCPLGYLLAHLSRRLTRWAYSIPMVRRPSVDRRRRPHFQTSISLKPVGQSWSNFICSITVVGERLRKVFGQIGSKLWFP